MDPELGSRSEVRALSGVKVLDLSRYAPGLFATALLAELGADVVTIEPPRATEAGPEAGDAPSFPRYGMPAARAAGTHPLWRGRSIVALDLKSADGRSAAVELVRGADVVVEGFRPGVAERLGLGFDDLVEVNERIVVCSLTGWGRDVPGAHRAGHDLNYLAETGVLAAGARSGETPAIPLNLVADMAAGGLAAAFNIVAALRQRDVAGEPVHLDVSMVRGILGMLAPTVAGMRAEGFDVSWSGGMLSGAAPFYDSYRTSDGGWMSVGAIEPKFFARLCEVLGLGNLVDAQLDESRWPEVRAALAAAFGSATRQEWEERFSEVDAAVSPVLSVGEAFERWQEAGVVGADGAVSVVAPQLRGRQA